MLVASSWDTEEKGLQTWDLRSLRDHWNPEAKDPSTGPDDMAQLELVKTSSDGTQVGYLFAR